MPPSFNQGESAKTNALADRFDHPVVVQPGDIDANGHANNVVYVRWIQDAAVAHWFAVVDPERARALSWVVVRHEVDYKQPALVGEALIVRTWVGAITKATCERFAEIRRAADDLMLARSRTVWCLIDPASGRPKRIDPTIQGLFWGKWPCGADQTPDSSGGS